MLIIYKHLGLASRHMYMMKMKEKSITMHQNHSDEEDEETLSLCDLPIYGESPQSKNENGGPLSCKYSEGDHHTSSSLDGQTDHFEFFSEEWSNPISYPAENVLFCGKLIVNKGYKQSTLSENPQKLIETTKQHTQENLSVLQQNFNSRTLKPHDQKGKCMTKETDSSLISAPSSNSLSLSNGTINNRKLEMLTQRITILKYPTRPRWFVFLFGSTRIPTDMEIKETRRKRNGEIKSQQSHGDSGKIRSSKRRGIRWWKLIRVLGCNNKHHADAVIKSSYSCAPLIRE